MDIEYYKREVSKNEKLIKEKLNSLLKGQNLSEIENILLRCDATGALPEWFDFLKANKGLPYGDGKTIGSIIEKLLVCVIEKYVLVNQLHSDLKLSINPAKGVDIPELELGVKSPSANMCTSEPFFSAYERFLGNEFDAIILLTNLQKVKSKHPLPLQIEKICYLNKTEIADKHLCETAKALRTIYSDDEGALVSFVRFLAYSNQGDWECSKLLSLINDVIIEKNSFHKEIKKIKKSFDSTNNTRIKKRMPLLDNSTYERLKKIGQSSPIDQGILKAVNDWMIFNMKDNGRYPNDNEWNRFLISPLNGKITMSFALQWRYNFKFIFQ